MFANDPALNTGVLIAVQAPAAACGGISCMARGESPSEQLGSALGGASWRRRSSCFSWKVCLPQIKQALQVRFI
jgi:hypothetical protein